MKLNGLNKLQIELEKKGNTALYNNTLRLIKKLYLGWSFSFVSLETLTSKSEV